MMGKPGTCLAVRAPLGNDDGIAGGNRHRTQRDPDLRTGRSASYAARQGPAAMGGWEGANSGCAGAHIAQGPPRSHMPASSYQHCTKTAVSFRFFGCPGRRGTLGCQGAAQYLGWARGRLIYTRCE